MDFTLTKYNELLCALQDNGYKFVTFEQYCEHKTDLQSVERFVILRHDVDLKPENSLQVAKIEHSHGVKSSYYFRAVPESWNEQIIKQIVALGHEIGYHYEDMSLCRGDAQRAQEHFTNTLAKLRQYYDVKTICMHGAPRSNYDSKDLWKTCDYRTFGVIGEPYFDTDFSDVFYLTDTGRRWDGYKVSVRDKIPEYQDVWSSKGLIYHTSNDVISALKEHTLPAHLMITTHPQRWTNNKMKWYKELLLQSAKNVVKRLLILFR